MNLPSKIRTSTIYIVTYKSTTFNTISVLAKLFPPIQKHDLEHYLQKGMVQLVNMGEKLKSLRIEKKLTQKQIAERVGLAISAISSYESGTRYPSYDVLIKLAQIFHVSTDYLLGMTDKRNIDATGLDDHEIDLISQLVDVVRNK